MAKSSRFSKKYLPFVIRFSVTFAVTIFAVACGKTGNDKTPITAAKPTEMEQKLATCASTKLTNQFRTIEGTERTFCRVDQAGLVQDVKIKPGYSAVNDGSRVKIGQVFAVKLDGKSGISVKSSEDEATLEKRLTKEKSLRKLLRDVCRPMVQGILQRSGISSNFVFRAKKLGDLPAQVGQPGAKTNSDSNLDDEDSAFFSSIASPAPAPRGANQPVANPGEATTSRKYRSPRQKSDTAAEPVRLLPNEYHAILEFVSAADGQVRFRDELDPVLSGSLEFVANVEATADQKHFCSQVALRIAENLGLAEGRDCKSRGRETGKCAVAGQDGGCIVDKLVADADVSTDDKAIGTEAKLAAGDFKSDAESETKSEPKADDVILAVDVSKPASADSDPNSGLMKAGRAIDDIKTVKLSQKELIEVLNPVCGPIEVSSQVKK